MRYLKHRCGARAFERLACWVEWHSTQGGINRSACFLGSFAARLAIKLCERWPVADRCRLKAQRII